MDFKQITEEYYSLWLGEENILCGLDKPVSFIYSPERDSVQPGFSQPFHLYILVSANGTIVSFGDYAADKMENLKQVFPLDINEIERAVYGIYQRKVFHNIKFFWNGEDKSQDKARALDKNDYGPYLSFFKKMNPSCGDTGWVREYFEEMAAIGTCCGVFENDMLVSCTDAPLMPYMPERVQEIGLNTLPDYRGRGYAALAGRLCASNIAESGRCPLYSCSAGNAASISTAGKIGFTKFADVYTI